MKVHHSHFVFQGIHSSGLCLCVFIALSSRRSTPVVCVCIALSSNVSTPMVCMCVFSPLCPQMRPLQWSVSLCFHHFAFKCVHSNGLCLCVFSPLCLQMYPLQWSVYVCFHHFVFKCVHSSGLSVCFQCVVSRSPWGCSHCPTN